jgi:ribosomal protein S18 acetylase RimI-like enzyme
VKLRSATTSDIPAVLSLWQRAGAEPSATDDEDGIAALLDRDSEALIVADDDGAVIGTAIAAWDGWRGNIYRVAVDPDRRRERIAVALVGQAEHRLRARGARRITLIVVTTAPAAMAFWRSCGYVEQVDRSRFVKNLD